MRRSSLVCEHALTQVRMWLVKMVSTGINEQFIRDLPASEWKLTHLCGALRLDSAHFSVRFAPMRLTAPAPLSIVQASQYFAIEVDCPQLCIASDSCLYKMSYPSGTKLTAEILIISENGIPELAADVPSQSLDQIAENGLSNGYTGTLATLSLDVTGQYMVLVTVTSIDPRISNYTMSSNFSVASRHQYKGLKIPAGLTHPRLRAHCAADPGRVCKDKAMRCGWDDATSESRFGNVEYVEGANQRWLKSVQQVWPPLTLLIMTELLNTLAH